MSSRDAGAALATFSLICGLLAFMCFGLAAIPAIILGHIALGHIGSAETSDARGRAWLGLFLGYINLAFFGLLGVLMAIGIAVGSDEDGRPTDNESVTEHVGAANDATGVEEATPPLPNPVQGQDREDDVFLVEGDIRYHTFYCRETGDSAAQRTRLADAIGAGFRPCTRCQTAQP